MPGVATHTSQKARRFIPSLQTLYPASGFRKGPRLDSDRREGINNSPYPASGYRAGNSGNLVGVGDGGFAWSNSPLSATGEHASPLNFYSDIVRPEYRNDRAMGLPVRCVKE